MIQGYQFLVYYNVCKDRESTLTRTVILSINKKQYNLAVSKTFGHNSNFLCCEFFTKGRPVITLG